VAYFYHVRSIQSTSICGVGDVDFGDYLVGAVESDSGVAVFGAVFELYHWFVFFNFGAGIDRSEAAVSANSSHRFAVIDYQFLQFCGTD
jgi:hypothetical protein